MRSLILLALLCSACGSSSPTAPAAPTPSPTPTPTAYTVTGSVTATNGGQALGGLAVDLNGQPATTNGAGSFAYTLTAGSTSRLALTGGGIVPRALTLNVGSGRSVAIDAIALGGAFDLAFYRSFIRNTFEAPTVPQPLRRWTRAPLVYMRTVDEAGQPIDAATLRASIDAVWSVGSTWTGGRFGIADVPTGTDTREHQSGWITVKWLNPVEAGICGRADVGLDGGVIELNYLDPNCACAGSKMQASTIRHELGHAFGFWHTGAAADLMSGLGSKCDQRLSAREQYHAGIAYARPIGNVDPDSDPTSTVNLAPMKVR